MGQWRFRPSVDWKPLKILKPKFWKNGPLQQKPELLANEMDLKEVKIKAVWLPQKVNKGRKMYNKIYNCIYVHSCCFDVAV